MERFIKIACNYDVVKVCLAAGCHVIVVHGIAQLAFVANRLFGLSLLMVCQFIYSNAIAMRVRIYHILPGGKAK